MPLRGSEAVGRLTLAEAPTSLREIRNEYCDKCPLHEFADTVCMMGTGPTPARVAIVGEAPGANEDRVGKPFIGAAGKLLDEELLRAGFDRDEMFVTNANRCRPPDNRRTTVAEQKACKPYLQAEMELVQPELTLLLGNSAMQAVLGTSGIMSKQNTIYEKDGRQYLPMLHPAFVLRDPTHLDSFRAGLAAAQRHLDKTPAPTTDIHMIDTPEAWEYFSAHLNDEAEVVSIDIESSTPSRRDEGGLQTWAPDWRLDTVAFSWIPGEAWVLPAEHFKSPWAGSGHPDDGVSWRSEKIGYEGMYDDLNKVLRLKRVIGHNVKFDLHGLATRGITAKAHFDTLVAAHLLDENRPSKSLKALARRYLGADLYEEGIKKDGTDPLDKLALYNGQDADYTLRLYHLFRDELLQKQNERLLRIFWFISMPALNTLLEVEKRGFPVSVRRLKERHEHIDAMAEEAWGDLLLMVPPDKQKDANFNRSNFFLWFMFEHMKLPIIKHTEKGAPSVDEETMLEYGRMFPDNPALAKVLEYRHWDKQRSTYTRKWIEQVKLKGEPRLYPNYNITGTVTGRLSSNFQQVPRDNYIRGIIGAPKGYTLIEADFSQIELRVAAMVSGDREMRAAYQQGLDLHMLTAMAITGKDPEYITKEERTTGKTLNFGLLYGAGWRKLQEIAKLDYGIELTDDQAQGYRNLFFMRYAGLRFWHDAQRRQVQVLKYVESPIGRRRRLPAVTSYDKEKAAEAERQAINSPVQSFASDLTLLAMVELENSDLFFFHGARIIGQVHDSILFTVPEGNEVPAAEQIKRTMDNLDLRVRKLFGYSPPVPIVADVKVHKYWGGE